MTDKYKDVIYFRFQLILFMAGMSFILGLIFPVYSVFQFLIHAFIMASAVGHLIHEGRKK